MVTTPRMAHIVMPLSTEGSSIAHVVRALSREHRAAKGSSWVIAADNRPHDFPYAEVIEVDYTRHCPKEYFTRGEYLVDAVAGAAMLRRPHGARIYEPAVEAVARLQPDWVVLHEGHYAVTVVPMLRRALSPHTRIALHVHNPISRSCLRHELTYLLRGADVILAVSDFVGGQVAARAWGARAKIHTLYNGVDLTRFTPAPPDAHHGPLRLLCIGQVAPHKGTHLLLEALVAMGDAAARFDLRIVGSTEHRSGMELSEYERSLRLLAERTPASVRFTAYQPQATIPDIYRWADVVCVPSVAEPFGMVAIEAMATGALVLANDAGALPEVVDSAGVLVDPSAAGWRTALSQVSRDLVGWHRDAAVHRASAFTWVATYERMLELLAEP